MVSFLLWLILFCLCWPLALLVLALYPIVWLISLPFRLLGMSVEAVFAIITIILLLPTKVWRDGRAQ